MDKMMYVGIGIVIVLVVAGYFLFAAGGSQAQTTQSTLPTTATTINTASTTVVTTGSTTTINGTNVTMHSCSSYPGSQCPVVTCTPSPGYGCSNVTYVYNASNGTAQMFVNIGQNTGQEWSGFGVGFAPNGTTYNSGVPVITFYTANASANNAGGSLQTGQLETVQILKSGKGVGINATPSGQIWACFINSGTLYIGNGCTSSGASPAQYVEIGTV